MRTTAFCAGFSLLISFTTMCLGQESLGEAARRLKAEKEKQAEQKSSASPVKPVPFSNGHNAASTESSIGGSAIQLSNINRLDDGEAYLEAIQKLFAQEKFTDLEEIARSARNEKARFVGGGWKLYTLYIGICGTPCNAASEAELRVTIERLQRWAAKYPQSITAQVALANAYQNYAWQARGDGYSDLVNDASWKPFEDRMRLARETLEKASRLKEKCPQWYVVMQKVARGQGWELARIRELLDDAISFEPLYYYNYFEYAFTLQPRWMGEEGDSERFAEEIANKIQGKESAEIYFKLATNLHCAGCAESSSTFSMMSWDRIKEGFSSIEDRYGVTDQQVNEMARLAVMAEDRPVALKAFLRVGDKWNKNVWKSKGGFDNSRQWAMEFPDDLKTAWEAAIATMQTSDGAMYSQRVLAEFNNNNGGAIRDCEKSVKDDHAYFQVAMKVSKDGMIQEVKPWPPTKFSACLVPKLSRAAMPPPPSEGVWVFLPVHFKLEKNKIPGEVYPETEGASVATGISPAGNLSADTDTDVNAMAEYRAGVQNLLLEQKFGELEKLAATDRTNKLRFKGGVWKLYVLYQGLKQPASGRMAADEDWNQHLKALATWASLMPDSDTAQIALAEASIIYAARIMNIKDTGDSVQRIHGSLHMAQLLLKQAADNRTKCPHWDFVMLELEERESSENAKRIFEEAIKKEPTYYPYYRLHALYQRPQWDSEDGAAEKFADDMANRVGGPDGDIIYFEIATALNISPSTKIFRVVNLSWPRIKRGYAALETKYGKSVTVTNQFAHLAMRSLQMEDAAGAFAIIGNRWDVDTWWSREYFEYSKAFVSASPEIMSLRRITTKGTDNPEGLQYQEQVIRDLLPQVVSGLSSCTDRAQKGAMNGYDLMFRVSEDGSVKELKSWPETKFSRCFTQNLSLPKLHVSAPPAGVEWVRVAQLPMPDLSR